MMGTGRRLSGYTRSSQSISLSASASGRARRALARAKHATSPVIRSCCPAMSIRAISSWTESLLGATAAMAAVYSVRCPSGAAAALASKTPRAPEAVSPSTMIARSARIRSSWSPRRSQSVCTQPLPNLPICASTAGPRRCPCPSSSTSGLVASRRSFPTDGSEGAAGTRRGLRNLVAYSISCCSPASTPELRRGDVSPHAQAMPASRGPMTSSQVLRRRSTLPQSSVR